MARLHGGVWGWSRARDPLCLQFYLFCLLCFHLRKKRRGRVFPMLKAWKWALCSLPWPLSVGRIFYVEETSPCDSGRPSYCLSICGEGPLALNVGLAFPVAPLWGDSWPWPLPCLLSLNFRAKMGSVALLACGFVRIGFCCHKVMSVSRCSQTWNI